MENKKIYDLIGKIKDKKLDKVYNKKSEYYGNRYWRLKVNIEDEPEIKEILAFKENLEKEFWQAIEESKYIDQRYCFKVWRKPGAGQVYQLVDWECSVFLSSSTPGSHSIIKGSSSSFVIICWIISFISW